MRNWVLLCAIACWLVACGDDGSSNKGNLDAVGDADATDVVDDATPDAIADVDTDEGDVGYPRSVTVEAMAGPIVGEDAGPYQRFVGLPFALPPVGDLRWKSPRPMPPWTEPRQATETGDICLQTAVTSTASTGSEDCLTLNIWTPSPRTENAPVMVWLHGGAFVLGSGSESTYNGRLLAQKGVIVVTVNYRLGPLGWLAHPALTAEDPERMTSGNYGLEDQRLALRWVANNIAAFGGDPENVTLFGESAGGISTCYHLVSPESAGLFDRAIIQSGPCITSQAYAPELQVAEAQGEDLAQKVGCDSDPDVLDCLRNKSAEEIFSANPSSLAFLFGDSVSWSPVQDGINIPEDPALTVANRGAADIPVMLGSNADEGTLFVSLSGLDLSDQDYIDAMESTFDVDAAAVLAEYPPSAFPTPNDAYAQVLGDTFTCSTRATARALADAGNDVYLYHFTYPFETLIFMGLGAFHAAELAFVFGNGFTGTMLKPEEEVLMDSLQGYWTRFAATGDPNGDDVMWPLYDLSYDQHLTLDLGAIAVGAELRKDRCDFWDNLGSTP